MSNLIKQKPATEPNEFQLKQMKRKFGMFIHFGVNTFGNTEWSDGMIRAKSYQPETIDADSWAKTAYEAGMNFIILITKHHDGFCLWDTKYTDYCVRNSGNTTDVVAELSKACKKYGLKLGLYYSLWDRKIPCYTENFKSGYLPYMRNQLTELMDGRYGDICELWLDGPWDKSRREWEFDKLYDLVKRLQPECQIGVNHTIGDNDGAEFPEERWHPENYQPNDPIRMFPSDFRLWDGCMVRPDDPKIYTFQNNKYYLPCEVTFCSREGFNWFYSNVYESEPLMDAQKMCNDAKIVFDSDNILVINLPVNTKGKLVDGDVENLNKVSKMLGLNRKWEDK